MSERMDVYVNDNAYTKIVHHFREAHHQMKLEKEDEMGGVMGGRKARYNSTTEVRRSSPTRWGGVERNHRKLHPRHKGKEGESVKEKGEVNNRNPVHQWLWGRLALLQ